MATAEEQGRRAMAARWDRWGGDIATGKECFGAEIWSHGEEVPPAGAVRLNYE